MGQQPGEQPYGGWPPPDESDRWAAPDETDRFVPPLAPGQPSTGHPPPPVDGPAHAASGPARAGMPTSQAVAALPEGAGAPGPAPVPREALDYPVLYDPAPAVERWYRRKRARTSRVVSIVLSVGISAALWWFFREDLGDLFWWIAGISLGLALAQFGYAAVQAARARRAIDRLHEGLALGIGRGGLYAHDTFLPWTQVAGLTTKPGRFGDSPSLVIRRADAGEPLILPLDFLGTRPAAIDGAVRALSAGRAWVDFSNLDV